MKSLMHAVICLSFSIAFIAHGEVTNSVVLTAAALVILGLRE